ncbi:hypothetical protein PG985_005424 [Apiospora marii]|uniref:uncharacterized protein n=1 Tax=Apiospora marii TaxID=335849 RepID=UPI00312E2321
MEKTKVPLGIDLGGTSVRAVFERHCVGDNSNTISSRFLPGEIPADIYPYDEDGLVYLNGASDHARRSVPAKYAFYAIVGTSDESLEQNPLAKELIDHSREDTAFKQRLRKGLVELFKWIACLCRVICEQHDYEIDVIGLSVPSQWTEDFKVLYKSIIVETFGDPIRVYFVCEIEALGHYLHRNHKKKLLQPLDKLDVVLFIDFGGYDTNTCIFKTLYDEKDNPRFHLISGAKGAGGGSAQWECNMAQMAVGKDERRLLPKLTNAIHDDLNIMKYSMKPYCNNHKYKFEGLNDEGTVRSFHIEAQAIKDSFDAAMEGPLKLARERIEELGTIDGHSNHRVVVSGGTSHHKDLEDKVRQMCVENGIKHLLFTGQWDIRYGPMKVAHGVVHVLLRIGDEKRTGTATKADDRDRHLSNLRRSARIRQRKLKAGT